VTGTNGRGAPAPRPLADLLLLRTDYEDVPVASLGGEVLRVYALSGTARAKLIPDMGRLAAMGDEKSPETVAAVYSFQIRVAAASVGYPEPEWDAFGALGQEAITNLYEVAARLSGLGPDSQGEAVRRLPRPRRVASGSD
jgi:hypothetical protein